MSAAADPASSTAPAIGPAPPVTGWGAVWRRFARKPIGVIACVVLAAYVLVIGLGPYVVSTSPDATNAAQFLPIGSSGHLLGTDELGRDLLARYLVGGRPLIIVAFASAALATILGTLIGLVAGYARGPVDQVAMRAMDVLLALPVVLLAVLLVSALGPGIGNLVVAITIAQTPYLARFVRNLAGREAYRDYVRSARALGIRPWRIIVGEILPNISGPVLVQATSILAVSAGFASALAFLGVGQSPSVPDWGYMVKSEEQFVYAYPMLTLVPALLITGFVLAANLIGDDLRDVLDPRRQR